MTSDASRSADAGGFDGKSRQVASGSGSDEEQRRVSNRRRRADWRLGGRSVRKWDAQVLSVALTCLGVGVTASILLQEIPAKWGPIASLAVLWVMLLAAIVFALLRSRPIGLFAVRPVDVVWALAFGFALRIVQGVMQGANVNPFPKPAAFNAPNLERWWFEGVVAPGLLGPVIEELFFRGVLVVVVYQLLRRAVGQLAAAVTAILISAGAFVILHGFGGSLTLDAAQMLGLLGVVCASLVVLTGRVWGAVATHIVYNASFLLITAIGVA